MIIHKSTVCKWTMFQTIINITILFNSVEHFSFQFYTSIKIIRKPKTDYLCMMVLLIGPKTAVQDKVECIKIMITIIQGSLLMHIFILY